ncbi:MAG: 50S ribosomal protein L13 [Gammaproteobacteria bacterium]
MKTFSAKETDIKRNWWIVDASDGNLGRLATQIARRLRGKHKPEYTPHVDTGDYVVVINADKIQTTGDKMNKKFYYNHTGFPGGIKSVLLKHYLSNHPDRVLMRAVKGMMPKNPLGRKMLKKLKIYAGTEHPHSAQNPQILEAGRK